MTIALIILLAAAFTCLVLESLSWIETKNHIVLTGILSVGGAVYFLLPSPEFAARPVSLAACTIVALMSILLYTSQLQYSKSKRSEAYALILVIYALLLWISVTTNLVQLTILSSLSNMLLVGLTAFRGNKRIASEIAVKFVILALFVFCLLCLAITISQGQNAKLGLCVTWISLLLLIGATPFFNVHVDYLDGAPPFASVLLLGSMLIGVGSFMVQMTNAGLDMRLQQVLLSFAGASVLIPPFLALDQQRIGRSIAYLCMTQVGVLLLLCLFKVPRVEIFFLHIALATPGAFAGVRFWKHANSSEKNWEDYAGAGRKHPYVGLSWLFILSSLAGAPLTLGFWIYLQLAESAHQFGMPWLLALIVLAIVVSMIPVARLGVFMFAKPTGFEMIRHHQPRQGFVIVLCALLVLSAKFMCYWLPTAYELKIFSP
ncbi:MAG: proton-conducting transporter membrane subunit [Myxococcota bacterium]